MGLESWGFISLSHQFPGEQASGTRFVLGRFPPSPAVVAPKVAGVKLDEEFVPGCEPAPCFLRESLVLQQKRFLIDVVDLHSGSVSVSPRGCSR